MSLRLAVIALLLLASQASCTSSSRQGPASTTTSSSSRLPGVRHEATPAPFPVPGDTSRANAVQLKVSNAPTTGGTIVVPVPPPGPAGSDSSALPKLGEYVYVEELPEALTRVPPTYPDDARHAGVQGTVMVQALVMRDGSVGRTEVVNSVPGLDEAAAAAVRQWRFKPAMAKGKPVTVWVAIPVKFSLH